MIKKGEKEKWIKNICDTSNHLIEVGYGGTSRDNPEMGQGLLRQFHSIVDRECSLDIICTKSVQRQRKTPSTIPASSITT
jgi:hypothetical protein